MDRGLPFGTIAVSLNGAIYEVTTFRVEGEYTDGRHPDSVVFVSDLAADLARRDFTINAMAYHPEQGLIDLFEGQKDLKKRVIKCVGKAEERFQEDALRILRALRFASVLGFTIESETEQALLENKALLQKISQERISLELGKILLGDKASGILLEYLPVFAEFIPELVSMVNFEQNNPYHCYDVLMHSLMSIGYAPKDIYLRLAMLFHDIGKPKCYTEKQGIGHFYGHPQISSNMAKEILTRLKFSNDVVNTVSELIFYHDTEIPAKQKTIKRWLNKLGEEKFRQLLYIEYADTMAKSQKAKEANIPVLNDVLQIFDDIVEGKQCFSLKDLAVKGDDLIALGMAEGEAIGETLNRLMDLVIEGKAENKKEELLRLV
jgi:tRNA nucleotidyltransferase (CCA-adding enzyme)